MYILVPHHMAVPICNSLDFQVKFLEGQQGKRDVEEQAILTARQLSKGRMLGSESGPEPANTFFASSRSYDNYPNKGNTDSTELDGDTWEQDAISDTEFFRWLDCHLDETETHIGPDFGDGQDNANADASEADINGFNHYLDNASGEICRDTDANGNSEDFSGFTADSLNSLRPTADGLNNTYVRIVHTNGIHHLAMVTCECHGHDNIPLDLIAA